MTGDEHPPESLPSSAQDVVRHVLAHPPLRLTRLGNGYRIDDVEFVLAELKLDMHEREVDAEQLRHRLAEAEAGLEQLRGEIEAVRQRERGLTGEEAEARRRSGEIEDAAIERARRLVADAELDAQRIRGDARLRIDETAAEFDELMRLKDGLLRSLRAVVRDFRESIERVGRGEPAGLPAAPRASLAPGEQGAEESPLEGEFSGTEVELIAGPFYDFASLSEFEQALSKLPHVSDVYVRHFASERAVIEVTLGEPAPFEDELRRLLPYPVEVRRGHDGTLEVDLATHDSSAAADRK